MRARLFIILTMISGALSAETMMPDWSGVHAEKILKRNRFVLKVGSQTIGSLACGDAGVMAGTDIQAGKASLVIDAPRPASDVSNYGLIYRSANILPSEYVPSREYELALEIKGNPGSNVKLFFEGSTRSGKHYWKVKNYILDGSRQELKSQQSLPPDLRNLHLRLDIKTPGKYEIYGGAFKQVKAKKFDSTRNYILNGGAEYGWYNTGSADMKLFMLSAAKEHLSWNGEKSYTRDSKLNIDENEFVSGSSSFKFETPEGGISRFHFNPVPTVPGERAYFSVWLKAAEPNTKVNLSLFLISGTAYGKKVRLGTEWQRYELDVPSWGGSAPGVSMFSDPLNGGGAVYNLVTPRVEPVENKTIWIDNAFYTLGGKGHYQESATFTLRGSLDKPRAYYVNGESPRAKLKIRNTGGKESRLEISWQVKDYFGRTILKGKPETLLLKNHVSLEKDYRFSPPAALRGPANWNFDIKNPSTGKTVPYNFYLGFLEKTGPQSRRSGLNFHTEQNIDTLIPMFRDFRLGSVRLWTHYKEARDEFRGYLNVPGFHKAGFFVMMCLHEIGCQGDPSLMVPRDLSRFQARLAAEAAKVKGMVDVYEILNEPNIWAGRKPNPAPDRYNQMSVDENIRINKAVKAVLAKVDPKAKLGGPATCHTDVAWTSNVLAGSADTLDVITEHPYRECPELPDYEADLKGLKTVLARYPKSMPIYASENGSCIPFILPDNLLTDTIRKATARDIRAMLIAFANGVEQYYQFAMNAWDAGTLWSVVQQGNPENDFLPRPAPYLFASKTVIDQVGDAKPLERIKLGLNYRCYLFEDGAERVAVLWKWNGESDTLRMREADAREIKAFDIVGTALDPGKIALNESPVYLRTSMSKDELKNAILSGNLNDTAPTVDVRLLVAGRRRFALVLKNRGGNPVSGRLAILTPGIVSGRQTVDFTDIPGESERRIEFTTAKELSISPIPIKARIETAGQKTSVEFNLQAIMPAYADKRLNLDGSLVGWPATKPILLDETNLIRLPSWSQSDTTPKAELHFAWNEDELYLAVKVFKPRNCETQKGISALYDGDGIQFAFDPLNNATPEMRAYQDDDYEYSIGAVKGRLGVFRHHVASIIHDGLEKKKGVIDENEIRRAMRVTSEYTMYQLAFPRQSLSPFRLAEGNSMRINLLINVNNGKSRIGYLEMTPGIGKTKMPGKFIDMVLLKADSNKERE
jgi:hypothetical protein